MLKPKLLEMVPVFENVCVPDVLLKVNTEVPELADFWRIPALLKLPDKLIEPESVVEFVALNTAPEAIVKFPSIFKVAAPVDEPINNVPALTVKSLATPMVFPFNDQFPPVPLKIKLL